MVINKSPGYCPSCGSDSLETFYEVRGVPVHSCLMTESMEEARSIPRADIELAFCQSCGFITNAAYDYSFRDYSPNYEDQQSYSPTFNSFARKLAERLVQKYDLHGKEIVEIGCGKGDFLVLLCELGGNRGVGIDPACVKERIESEAADRIIVIQDYYSQKYADYTGDFLLCRHTLEHIRETADFLNTIREALGQESDTVVFFEIPETIRILREQAFWDIYYEHCSYFTPGSLARLFRHCGFEVLDVSLAYNQQYLLIEASATEVESPRIHDVEESIDDLRGEVERFTNRCDSKLKDWQRRFEHYQSDSKRVAIWGSGSKCVSFLTTLGMDAGAARIVDINPHRHDKFIPGVAEKVMPPEFLSSYRPDVVIVMNPVYKDEIEESLSSMGLKPEIITV
jgi:SAM-dependent methyltransferase